MSYKEESLKLHIEYKGKIEVVSKVPLNNKHDLSLAYTPGVAEPCKRIAENLDYVYKYTNKANLVAVVTDGTAVLGLGDIGPEASLPVMEGKCLLFKQFGGIDAFPICLNTKNTEEIVETICRISPGFGGINLEDISSPRCFEIETKLKEKLDIPVFHDDQHGTAIVILAGLINALKIVNKEIQNIKIVINGAGAAGIAIGKLLLKYGARHITYCDRNGILNKNNATNDAQLSLCNVTNLNNEEGSLDNALADADVFIGVSAPNVLTSESVFRMNNDSIVFACANPTPEIYPDEAKKGGARIVATGRSDYPNQINNVLVFPGIFRGALDVGAKDINDEMKIAAAIALANIIEENELSEDYIIPDPFDTRICSEISKAVAEKAIITGATKNKS